MTMYTCIIAFIIHAIQLLGFSSQDLPYIYVSSCHLFWFCLPATWPSIMFTHHILAVGVHSNRHPGPASNFSHHKLHWGKKKKTNTKKQPGSFMPLCGPEWEFSLVYIPECRTTGSLTTYTLNLSKYHQIALHMANQPLFPPTEHEGFHIPTLSFVLGVTQLSRFL